MAEKRDAATDGNLAKVYDLVQQPEVAADPTDAVHQAIDQCMITMVYQPIVELATGKVFAYEALCRSRVPQFDSPPALIEAATAAGRIGELGRLQRRLASRNCPDHRIFLNISPHEFDDVFLVRPDDAIFRHRKPVYIEITESVPLVFFDQCHSVLGELRRKGARLAIDDLGAGYSNLKYIADLAPDVVKLDRDLVAGCSRGTAQYKLLCSIAQLCREVDAKVVAEGVENAEELDAVISAGIELCQGFYLGRPKSSPPEVSWPATDLLSSGRVAQVGAATRRARSEGDAEAEERHIEEMENLSAALEKSLRKHRGEVVRLKKALGKAETGRERARSRLAEVERSLERSESERDRLATLGEAPAEPEIVAAEPPPTDVGRLRRVASYGLACAVGAVVGLGVYLLAGVDSGAQTLESRQEVIATPTPLEVVVAEVPEPVGLAPKAVSTSPAEASVEPPIEVALPSPELVAREEVVATLDSWAAGWSSQSVESYLEHYTAEFTPESGVSGATWRSQRVERLGRPEFIEIGIDEVEVTLGTDGAARARFVQTYRSNSYEDQVRKEMNLRRENNRWLIAREVVIR